MILHMEKSNIDIRIVDNTTMNCGDNKIRVTNFSNIGYKLVRWSSYLHC